MKTITHSDQNKIRLDLNNPIFQENLFALQKNEQRAVLDTLNKLRQLTWQQVYRDNGIKWEKLLALNHLKTLMPCIRYALLKIAEQPLIVTVIFCDC